MHAPRPVHHRDHQQVAQDAHQEDEALKEGSNDPVIGRVVRRVLLPRRAVHQPHFRQHIAFRPIRYVSVHQQQQ